MSRMFQTLKRSQVISGDVCLVRLHVTSPEDRLLDWPTKILGNSEYRLREEISEVVQQSLGPEFEVRSMTVGRGSIEILVLIGTAFYAISRYRSFVESMELLMRQLRKVVRFFFERSAQMSVSVSGSWTPMGGIPGAFSYSLEDQNGNTLILWYLILSHAGMLAVLLWLLIGSLKP
jgi:hypothetical protein